MKLNLTVSGKLIASTPVASFMANNDQYLKALRRQLTIRHRKKLQTGKNEPCFALETQPENMR